MFTNFSDSSPLEFFEFLGEFPSHDDPVIGSEVFFHVGKRPKDAVNGFVDDHRIVLILQRLKEGFSTLFHGEESEKSEIVHMHPGSDECRENRGSSRDGNDSDVFLDCPLYEDIGGIGDSRCSCIGYECDMFSFGEKREDFFHFHIPGMCMERDERFRYLVVIQENSGGSGVLTGDDIRFAESTERPEGDVLEIAYRSGDDGEHFESDMEN